MKCGGHVLLNAHLPVEFLAELRSKARVTIRNNNCRQAVFGENLLDEYVRKFFATHSSGGGDQMSHLSKTINKGDNCRVPLYSFWELSNKVNIMLSHWSCGIARGWRSPAGFCVGTLVFWQMSQC